MKKLISLVFALSLFVSAQAMAAADKYSYDPLHTQIMFSVNHLGYSFPHGKFNKFSGSFMFDQANPEVSQAEITIDTDSLDLDSAKWEEHMKSPDFFNVQKFPAMTFKSTKITKTGGNTATMTGDMTMLGVTKPVTLNVTFNKAGTFPMNKNYVAGFSLSGTLKRSDFGMTYGIPMVSDDVNLIIEVEGIRQDFENISK